MNELNQKSEEFIIQYHLVVIFLCFVLYIFFLFLHCTQQYHWKANLNAYEKLMKWNGLWWEMMLTNCLYLFLFFIHFCFEWKKKIFSFTSFIHQINFFFLFLIRNSILLIRRKKQLNSIEDNNKLIKKKEKEITFTHVMVWRKEKVTDISEGRKRNEAL